MGFFGFCRLRRRLGVQKCTDCTLSQHCYRDLQQNPFVPCAFPLFFSKFSLPVTLDFSIRRLWKVCHAELPHGNLSGRRCQRLRWVGQRACHMCGNPRTVRRTQQQRLFNVPRNKNQWTHPRVSNRKSDETSLRGRSKYLYPYQGRQPSIDRWNNPTSRNLLDVIEYTHEGRVHPNS